MREDLARLTPEVLAATYNLGLVRRAERERAAGQGPALSLAPDRTLTGTFPDGVTVRVPPGAGLADASCSCGARSMCRHRIAVALGCAAGPSEAAAPPVPPPPADFSDDALARHLGSGPLAAAHTSRRRGVVVSVQRSPRGVTVWLPTCSVTFPAGAALAAARCDCAAAGPCEHLALAVWALRETDPVLRSDETSGPRGTFELSGAVHRAPADTTLLDEIEHLGAALLRRGAARAEDRLAEPFTRLRTRAAAARMTWIADLLEDLEHLIERYAARSARYDENRLLRLLVELFARSRAARDPGELPAAFVLGTFEPAETLLERVRLISLGARVTADGPARAAALYLADPGTGSVCVLRKQWSYAAGEVPEAGPALARRTVLPRIDLGTLAAGNVVSTAVRRRASLEVWLGSQVGQTTLLPGGADFSALAPPLLTRTRRALQERLAAAPPECLRPRLLTDGVVVFAVTAVERVFYDPAAQICQADLRDAEGEILSVRAEHRAVAPGALEALATALTRGARYVTGHLRWDGSEVTLDVLGVATADAFVVLDLAEPAPCARLEAGSATSPQGPLAAPLTAAARLLAEAAHHGLTHLPRDYPVRLHHTARRCEDAGLLDLAEHLRRLADAAPGPGGPARWADAALHWELLHEG